MSIVEIHADQYRVPLETLLSDSTHGEMADFGLIVVRLVDEDGLVGLGYTYTVNTIGAGALFGRLSKRIWRPYCWDADPRRH